MPIRQEVNVWPKHPEEKTKYFRYITLPQIVACALGALVAIGATWAVMRHREPLHRALGFWGNPWDTLWQKQLCFSRDEGKPVCLEVQDSVQEREGSITLLPAKQDPRWDARYAVEKIFFTTAYGGQWFVVLRCPKNDCDYRELKGWG